MVDWRNQQNALFDISDRVTAVIVDAPKYTLYRPTTKVNVLAGGILGLILGGVVVFLVEYREAGIIRSSTDVDRMSLPVLGAIPAEAALAGRGRLALGSAGSRGRSG